MTAALASLPFLVTGFLHTIGIALTVIALSTVLGALLGLLLTEGPRPVRYLVRCYVEVVRGIPLLVLIFVIYYGLPSLGLNMNALITAILALTMFKASQMAEVARAGLQSIPLGQHDGARALGLHGWQRFCHVVAPQVIRRVLPPWVNLVADAVKDTALLSLLGIVDLMLSIQQVIGRTYEAMPVYLVGIALYFSINFSLSVLSRRIDRRMSAIG